MAASPIEAAAMLALKQSSGVELKRGSFLPDAIVSGMVSEIVEAATVGDPIDWKKMDPSGLAAVIKAFYKPHVHSIILTF